MATKEMDINNAFQRLLQRLEPDLHPSARYQQLRLKMIKFFKWRRCEDSDALADETISRVVKNLSRGEEIRTDKPYSYVYAIAMNVYREYVRNQVRREELLQKLPDRLPQEEDWQDCRIQCLRKLSSDKLDLLQEYYLNIEGRASLAQKHSFSINALRLQVHRVKKELRACHKECRKKLPPV